MTDLRTRILARINELEEWRDYAGLDMGEVEAELKKLLDDDRDRG